MVIQLSSGLSITSTQLNYFNSTQERNVPAIFIYLSRTAVQPIYVNSSREIE